MAKKRKEDGGTATVEKQPKRGESPEEIKKILEDVEKAEKAVQVAEIELDSRKEAAKSAKAEWMVKVAELRERVRTRERWREEARRQPLLNGQNKPAKAAEVKLPEGAKLIGILRDVKDIGDVNGKTLAKKGDQLPGFIENGVCRLDIGKGVMYALAAEDWTEIEAKPAAEVTPFVNIEWRKLGIDKLAGKVTESDRTKLAAGNLLTLGDLQDRMQKHGTFWAKDIKGIGEAAQTRIEDAFNASMMEGSR